MTTPFEWLCDHIGLNPGDITHASTCTDGCNLFAGYDGIEFTTCETLERRDYPDRFNPDGTRKPVERFVLTGPVDLALKTMYEELFNRAVRPLVHPIEVPVTKHGSNVTFQFIKDQP